MARAAARTAILPMTLVALEQYLPPTERIIDDPLAGRLLPPAARLFVRFLRNRWAREWMLAQVEKNDPGIWSALLCRKRYIDDQLLAARHRIEAVVILGAGFDTRPYRLPALSALPVWELDQPGNIEAKQKRLRHALPAIPPNVQLVPADFDRDDPAQLLAARGYSPSQPTFFIWEGVTQYLTERGVRSTFDWLAQSAPASRLIFTYVRKDFLDGRNLHDWESGYRRFVTKKVWQFGIDPEDCPDFLRTYGWRLVEDLAYDALAGRYVKPTGRHLSSTPVERIVYAEKQ